MITPEHRGWACRETYPHSGLLLQQCPELFSMSFSSARRRAELPRTIQPGSARAAGAPSHHPGRHRHLKAADVAIGGASPQRCSNRRLTLSCLRSVCGAYRCVDGRLSHGRGPRRARRRVRPAPARRHPTADRLAECDCIGATALLGREKGLLDLKPTIPRSGFEQADRVRSGPRSAGPSLRQAFRGCVR